MADFVTVFKFDGLNPRQHLTGHLALPENHMKYLLLRIVMLYEHNNNRSFATDGQPTCKIFQFISFNWGFFTDITNRMIC